MLKNSTQLWMKDTTSEFDDVDFTNGDNTSGIMRMAYIKESSARSTVSHLTRPISSETLHT